MMLIRKTEAQGCTLFGYCSRTGPPHLSAGPDLRMGSKSDRAHHHQQPTDFPPGSQNQFLILILSHVCVGLMWTKPYNTRSLAHFILDQSPTLPFSVLLYPSLFYSILFCSALVLFCPIHCSTLPTLSLYALF